MGHKCLEKNIGDFPVLQYSRLKYLGGKKKKKLCLKSIFKIILYVSINCPERRTCIKTQKSKLSPQSCLSSVGT